MPSYEDRKALAHLPLEMRIKAHFDAPLEPLDDWRGFAEVEPHSRGWHRLDKTVRS
jgi:hypothetical protein